MIQAGTWLRGAAATFAGAYVIFVIPSCGKISAPLIPRTPAGEAALRLSPRTAATSCRQVIHKQILLDKDTPVKCAADSVELFKFTSTDYGPAVAQVRIRYRNNHEHVSQHWTNSVRVGGPHDFGDGRQVTPNGTDLGDNICPGVTTGEKGNLGYGYLSSAHPSVRVYAGRGANPCVDSADGPVVALKGSRLDIWIEDPKASCFGQTVGFAPTIASKEATWTAGRNDVRSLALPSLAGRGGEVKILAVNEGFTSDGPISQPPPKCGFEVLSLTSQIRTNIGTELDSKPGVRIPASEGVSHLVISHHVTVPVDQLTDANSLVLRGEASFTTPEVFVGASKLAYVFLGDDSAQAIAPVNEAILTSGAGSCPGNDCGWALTSSVDIACQPPNQPPTGKQLSGNCDDAGSTNYYEWSDMKPGNCAGGTYLRYGVTQKCQHAKRPPCSPGKCRWVTLSDAAYACQYGDQGPVGEMKSGSCAVENEENIYFWGTGQAGGCESPTFIRNKGIQRCVPY